jgi:hypothetical protein
MDLEKILAELKANQQQIEEEAIVSLERRARGRGPGMPPGSNDSGPLPPPAAPAAARIASRLDRAVSQKKLPQGS